MPIYRGTRFNDWLDGEASNDLLQGFSGHDILFGFSGNDTLDGGTGGDWLIGGPGQDRLIGGAGNDLLHGNDGHDQMDGGDGNDTLDGGEGHDRIDGGLGVNTIHGGGGYDTALFTYAFSAFTITRSNDLTPQGNISDPLLRDRPWTRLTYTPSGQTTPTLDTLVFGVEYLTFGNGTTAAATYSATALTRVSNAPNDSGLPGGAGATGTTGSATAAAAKESPLIINDFGTGDRHLLEPCRVSPLGAGKTTLSGAESEIGQGGFMVL